MLHKDRTSKPGPRGVFAVANPLSMGLCDFQKTLVMERMTPAARVARKDKADKVIITQKGFFCLVLALLWIKHSLIQAGQERHS